MGSLPKAPTRDHQIRNIARGACLILIVGVSVAYVLAGARQPWDFQIYYYASSAYRSGLDPYSTTALSVVAGKHVELPFLYTPATLVLFTPWTALPLQTAAMLWLAFKAALVVGLIFLWHREFLKNTSYLTLVAVSLLGFDLAVLWDLRTGNVAIVEAVLLSAGVAAYARGRFLVTACCIGLASVFKLTPVLLLGVLTLPPGPPRRRLARVLIGLAFPTAAILLPPGLSSEWVASIWRSIADTPHTQVNPSSFAVVGGIAGALELPSTVAPVFTGALYLLYCTAVLVLSLGMLLRCRTLLERALLVVLLWLLLSPRLMIYSYTMAIVPTIYAIESRIPGGPARWVAVAAILAEGMIRLLPGQSPGWTAPMPLLVLWGAWFVWLRGRPGPERIRISV